MAIRHSTTATSGARGMASDWNADHVIDDETKALRSATFIVAASDSLDSERADYICDGTADQSEINQAINALPATGGKVILLEGTYNITASVSLKAYASLEGQGRGSLIKLTSGTAGNIDLVSVSNVSYVSIASLAIDGNSGATVGNNYGLRFWGNYNYLRDVHVSNCKTNGFYLFGSFVRVSGISATSCGCNILIRLAYSTVTGCIATSSTVTYGIYLYQSTFCTVTGNISYSNTGGDIVFQSGASHNLLIGNRTTYNTGSVSIFVTCNYNTLVANGYKTLNDGGVGTIAEHNDVV